MANERTIEIGVVDGVIVRFNQSGRPIERYSVILKARIDGAWKTLRVYDNHLGSHHMHRYTRQSGKQPGKPFHEGPAKEAIPAAIAHLKAHREAIIESWKS
jgi:hypothetical protein